MNSPIIKKAPFKTDLIAFSSNVAKKSVLDAQQLAKKIIMEAEAEAEQIRSSAIKTATEVHDKAAMEGYEKGLSQFNEYLIGLKEYRDRAMADLERDMVTLAIKIAERVIGYQIEKNDQTLVGIINTAIRNIRQTNLITIRVNPSELAIVQSHRDQLDPTRRAKLIDLVGDLQVLPGGCIIESEVGKVDARLETQLRVLERCLLDKTDLH